MEGCNSTQSCHPGCRNWPLTHLAGQAQKVWEQRLTVGAPAGSKIYHSLSGDGGEGRPFVTLHCNIHHTFVMSVPHTKISQFCSCSR